MVPYVQTLDNHYTTLLISAFGIQPTSHCPHTLSQDHANSMQSIFQYFADMAIFNSCLSYQIQTGFSRKPQPGFLVSSLTLYMGNKATQRGIIMQHIAMQASRLAIPLIHTSGSLYDYIMCSFSFTTLLWSKEPYRQSIFSITL